MALHLSPRRVAPIPRSRLLMADAADASVPAQHVVGSQDDVPKKPTLGKKILGLLWDSLDDKSPEEHRLVRRLDSFYLVWACFYYFVMYLDSSKLQIAAIALLRFLREHPRIG